MTLSNAVLDILFRRINPEEVLAERGRHKPEALSKLCMTKAESTLSGYSYEEKEGVIRYYLKTRHDQIWRDTPRQLHLAAEIAGDMLLPGENSPICRYESVLDWREAYLLLGQDLFTVSWLAKREQSQAATTWFSWPSIIPVDNPVLARVTENLAENHMHLMAGASTFALTWCCLMNHPKAIYNAQGIDIRLQPYMTRTAREIWPAEKSVMYAAYLRLTFFRRICGEIHDVTSEFRGFCARYTIENWISGELDTDISNIRRRYGIRFPQPGMTDAVCLDYAFTAQLQGQEEEHSRLLASERWFLYQCFCMCYDGRLSIQEQWLFYVYLLIKSQFRSEFVQVNRQVGFHNFHDYDSRKAMLWKDSYPEYVNEDYRQTINANIQEQGITSLEGRISPARTESENISWAAGIDRAVRFYDRQNRNMRAGLKREPKKPQEESSPEEAKHFYVLHFPKEADKSRLTSGMAPACRHQEYREGLRKKSIELAKALSNSDDYVRRIRGIDACSFEIACRPEVFGTAFRFLRSFPVQRYRRTIYAQMSPRLGITYHVGEDFLDIADGLRAVDEAINFLGMARGDRLGHATVLGVDPQTHYACKNRQIVMSKQELLDNYIWLLYRSGELGVDVPMILRQRMNQRAYGLFSEIYRDKVSRDGTTLEDYYRSMKLRGDDPQCYQEGAGGFRRPPIKDGFDMYCVCDSTPELKNFREQKPVSELCFLYHYCHGVRNKGSETDTADIDDEYISLMGKMQKAMREYVNKKGISIESNLSSNVLIGTFGSYQKHPILTFYSRGLGIEEKGVQMHVSINTDDPGVFDTSLSFEYDLLAGTLQQIKDSEGNRLNTDRAIEDYIRDLVRMGHEQVFPAAAERYNRSGIENF